MAVLLAVLCVSAADAQKFKGLALTPPMGWNSWNTFACDVNEQLIRGMADVIASSGMKEAGYQYVVIDDCWHGKRDSLGFIHENPERFPSGMKALADYIHSKGLKFGIYSCAGDKTCGGHPGSRGHEYQDAITYAQWGVDYLKYDWCNTAGLKAEGAYMTMRDALYAAGRPVVFSICEWGDNQPWNWGKDIGHLWRTSGDITDCFDCELNHGTWSQWGVMKIVEMAPGSRTAGGPDHWNDPDMLEVGRGMTLAEDRSHFSLWCMLAAPLMAGNDLRGMKPEVLAILTNGEVIAVDQDTLGVQGFRHSAADSIELWVKPLAAGDWAVCFLNRTMKTKNIEHTWAKTVVTDTVAGRTLDASTGVYEIRDLWNHKNLGTTSSVLKTELGAHDILMLRLKKR